ncbi:hypothetical protein [Noviherbaspirillum sedimenti]|nr:hypothetical protein [Noviherbaspirillum sedimenti]
MLLQDILNAYTNHPDFMKMVSIVPFMGGFLIWCYFYFLSVKDRKMPIPFWMYTFWFAHDATAAVVFYRLAEQHNGFWFFQSTWIMLVVWCVVEIVGMCLAVRFARQDIWGKYFASPVTKKQATGWVLAEIAAMFAVVFLLRGLMDDDTMFKWFVLTNAVMAIGPFYLWRTRTDRTGSSIVLAIIFVIIVANNFSPPGIGMFTTASPYFDQPWFYFAGVVLTLMTISNLFVLLRLPSKKAVEAKWQQSPAASR